MFGKLITVVQKRFHRQLNSLIIYLNIGTINTISSFKHNIKRIV